MVLWHPSREPRSPARLSSLAGVLLGAGDCSFPPWLKSLMTICCCVNDCSLQNIAIATLLEVINHSQSLALVIEDKMKRYKTSGNNPFFGKLQMVTVPPIAPGILKVIAEKTDFYQVFPPGRYSLSPELLTGTGAEQVSSRGLEGPRTVWSVSKSWLLTVCTSQQARAVALTL